MSIEIPLIGQQVLYIILIVIISLIIGPISQTNLVNTFNWTLLTNIKQTISNPMLMFINQVL